MKLSLFHPSLTDEVKELFTTVFSTSESEAEGQMIGRLVSDLIATTESGDLFGFVASSNGVVAGCIFFSRFIVPGDEVSFILSPVAIATDKQGKGLGQQLINYGLDHLNSQGVELVFTYGDPNYYCKTGFRQISESVVKAPLSLSQPEGWLAQSLDGSSVKTMEGRSTCVGALNNQKYW